MSLDTTNSSSGGPYRKPRADLYTFLLLLALMAILAAIACLYAEMKMYDFEFKGAPVASAPEVPVTTDAAGLCGADGVQGGWGIAQRCPGLGRPPLHPPIT